MPHTLKILIVEPVRKRFDKDLHAQYDKLGRDVVKGFVNKNWEMEAEDNPNPYGIDLLLYKDGVLCGLAEVEVRPAWKTIEFPYEDLNVPQRKRKLLENTGQPTFFFSVNKDGTALFHCDAESVLQSELKESHNKYVRAGEYFFKVPLDKLTHIVL